MAFFEFKDGKTFLNVRVSAKASRNAVTGVKNDSLAISVTSVPENGKANKAVVKVLSERLACAKSKIQLVQGETCRNKLFVIDGDVRDTLSKEVHEK